MTQDHPLNRFKEAGRKTQRAALHAFFKKVRAVGGGLGQCAYRTADEC